MEHSPGRADERMPLAILAVAGLLANEHRRGTRAAFAEDRLRRVLVEVASPAVRRLCAQGR